MRRSYFLSLIFAVTLAACGTSRALGATIPDLSGNGHSGTPGAGFAAATSPTFNGSYATFARPTDTILLKGNVSFQNQATYEAKVRFSTISYPPSTSSFREGGIWDSWQDSAQDTRLSIVNGGKMLGYAYGVESPTNVLTGGTLQTGQWYDLAYVYDGNQDRIYIDGSLVGSHAASGNIPLGSSNIMTIGAIFRDRGVVPSFQGDLQSLRISNSARYSGDSYTPVSGDYTSDSTTQLLFNFGEVPEPSAAFSLGVFVFLLRRRGERG